MELLDHENNRQVSISEKMEYIKNLYKNIKNDTVLIVTSDSNKDLPLIIAKKDSNFTDPENSLYKSENINLEDLAPTLCALLSIEVPRFSQGKFIDEAIHLLNPTEDEKNLIYLDLRQQQQRLLRRYIECNI